MLADYENLFQGLRTVCGTELADAACQCENNPAAHCSSHCQLTGTLFMAESFTTVPRVT
jgi:hypothetical protein